MSNTKIFKLALDEEYYKKVEELQMVLPGQMYKSDVIRAAIDYLYSMYTPNEIRKANGLEPILDEMVEMIFGKMGDNNEPDNK